MRRNGPICIRWGDGRFLILPSVHVPNLASRVLSLCMSRVAKDWTERYGYAPVLAETFVDPRHFAGTCYRAANWQRVGQTAARVTAYPNGKTAEGPQRHLCVSSSRRNSAACSFSMNA